MYIATTYRAESLLNTHGDIFTREFLFKERPHWVLEVVSLFRGYGGMFPANNENGVIWCILKVLTLYTIFA